MLIFGVSTLFYVLFTAMECSAFVSFLFVQIKNVAVRKTSMITCVAFILFIVIYALSTKEKILFDSVPIGIETIIILLFSFYYLYEKMDDTTTLYIYSTFPFWIVIGMVLYLSGCFFIYIFSNTIPLAQSNKYWFVTNIFSILKSTFFTIAIIVNSKPSKRIPPSAYNFSSLN